MRRKGRQRSVEPACGVITAQTHATPMFGTMRGKMLLNMLIVSVSVAQDGASAGNGGEWRGMMSMSVNTHGTNERSLTFISFAIY